jgi:acetylornithine deacetylase/succinyl-diaminopimelate desuccinylase-like protein
VTARLGTGSAAYIEDGRDDLVQLLGDLVRLPTLGPGDAVEAALEKLSRELDVPGVAVSIQRSADGVPTLLATVDSAVPGPHVMLQGHIDVVPVDEGWGTDPFAATITEGFMVGRGTCDMKAGLASFVQVIQALGRTGELRRGAVTLLVDVDEETGSDRGLIPFIASHGLDRYDWAICGEPTAMRPYLGNRGLIWSRVKVNGRAAHAGMPHAGLNPVPVLAKLVTELPAPEGGAGPYGGSGPSLTPTVFRAGEVPNSIASAAELLVDRRVVPGEDLSKVRAELELLVDDFRTRFPDFTLDVETLKEWPPCLLDERSTLARQARAIAEAAGCRADFGFDDACNDASFLEAAGVPTLIWGPGEPEMAHVSNERIELDHLVMAPRMYLDAVLALTSAGSDD